MVKRILWISALAFLLLAPVSFAEKPDMPKPLITHLATPPKKVLSAGNSFLYYNNSVEGYARDISSELGDPITLVAIGGSGQDGLLGKPFVITSPSPSRYIDELFIQGIWEDKGFDAIILRDRSQAPINSKLAANFTKDAATICARARAAGAEPLIMLTWAYADKPETMESLARAAIEVANANSAMVVPVALAFAKVADANSAIKLIEDDKKRLTPAGAYLEACVIVATLTGKSPLGVKGHAADEEGAPKEAEFLQKVAWETVKDFFGWKEK